MKDKVLFVDDEERLLNAIQRRFQGQLNLETAVGGAQGLERIQAHGPYAVVVTDMRMPGMDGLQFIEQARKIAKHTVFVMLTGNQDLTTAVDAVNRGQVFRFLTKPCPAEKLMETVKAAIKQYDLVVGRHDLLNNTFCGSVKLLCEVLELAHPEELGRTQEVQRILDRIVRHLHLGVHWEFKVAARLANVGLVVVSASGDETEEELLRERATAAARLVHHIPRLENVAEIIRCYPDSSGQFPDITDRGETLVTCGATLLRVANELHAAYAAQMPANSAVARLRNRLPDLPAEVAQAARRVLLELQEEVRQSREVEVPIDNLQEGMVLADHLVRLDGTRILSRGTALSSMFIDRIRRLAAQGKLGTSIRIMEVEREPADELSRPVVGTSGEPSLTAASHANA